MTVPPNIDTRTNVGRWLNDFSRSLRERTPVRARNFRVFEHTVGFTVAWTPPRKSAAEETVTVRQFKLFALGGDVLYCRPLNAANEVTGTNWPTQIAKPYFLRTTPFNARTVGTLFYTYAPADHPPRSQQVRRVSVISGPQNGFNRVQAVIPRYTIIALVDGAEQFLDSDPTLFPSQIAYSDIIYAARIYTDSKTPRNKPGDPAFEEDDDYTISGDPEFGGVYWQDLNVDARHWAQI